MIQMLLAAVAAPAAVPLSDQPAEVRLVFGLVADNSTILQSAFAPEVDGSIIDATKSDPVTVTEKGAANVTHLAAGIEKMTGDIEQGECKPGQPGKSFCEFKVGRGNRYLQAFVDKNEAGIFSVIFVVSERR